ncbi:MAG: DUF3536 domain-containing protein [Cyclobacteriaceae bacterium]|nr:DUF3536 domain-containing protein [Cyclobacteriaceae bacterium]
MTKPKRFICIHGHFYQPPRENAWLEVIELQDSAHPFHDWNERISAECYGPNTASRILGDDDVITKIQNNYSKISFNIGPTLLSWMERYDLETYEAILEADKDSIKRFGGHGSAMAQVYNHMIMPLANFRDKETQVIWGIRDFEARFKRKPEGMWLAETAVDTETLEVLAANEINFTVLAPRQAMEVRKIGDTNWQPVNDHTVNTLKSYRCNLPSGKHVDLFFYNGDIAQGVAFNGLLNDGRNFAERLSKSFDEQDSGAQLVHIATDGETYGHHHHHGDMALAFCLDYIEKNKRVDLINYGQFLELYPPEYEVRIIENSSWSCVHGVERWRNNCGCNTGGHGNWNQEWRKPLRETLDWLRDILGGIFEREALPHLENPWDARNDYIKVILKRSDANTDRFLKQHARQGEEVNANKILRMLEMQRHAMLMYTSCGWFFDEVSGIETAQILQYACRAIQLSRQLTAQDIEAEFLERLSKASSNVATYGHAGNVYLQQVLPSKTNLQRVGMHYAVSSIFEDEPETLPLFNYKATNEVFLKKEAGEQKLALGITKVQSLVTRSEKNFAFAVIYLGKHDLIGNLKIDMEPDRFASMQFRMVNAFENGRLGEIIELMQTYFGPTKYTIWHLFQDEKRKILELIANRSLRDLEDSLRRTYDRDYPLVNALSNNRIPIPNAYRTTFEYILNADLLNCFQPEKINIKTLQRVIAELERWKLKIEDPVKLARIAGESIFKELRRVGAERENVRRVQRFNKLFPLLEKFNIEPNLSRSQNQYFEIAVENKARPADEVNQEWLAQFVLLGENLGVKIDPAG